MTGIGWVESHGIECLLSYFVFSCFVGGMPTPKDDSSVGYRWAFTSFTLLSAGLARFVATQFPESKMGQALTSGPPVQPVVVAKIEPAKEK